VQLFKVVREWQGLKSAEMAAKDLRAKRAQRAAAQAERVERAEQREARQVRPWNAYARPPSHIAKHFT
jgi:hypothetical protein